MMSRECITFKGKCCGVNNVEVSDCITEIVKAHIYLNRQCFDLIQIFRSKCLNIVAPAKYSTYIIMLQLCEPLHARRKHMLVPTKGKRFGKCRQTR